MSALASIALIACIVNIGLPLLILSSNFQSTLNRVFLVWSLSVFTWNAASVPLLSSISDTSAYYWMLVLQAGVFLMPATLFHVSIVTVGKSKYEKFLPWAYGVATCFCAMLGLGWVISGVRKLHAGYWAVANWGYYLFIVYFLALTLATMVILYRSQTIASPLSRRRIIALLCAILGLWIFGTNDMLPIFGVTRYPFIHREFVPIGNAASIGYALVIGYSVIQHQLLDVKVGLSKFAASLIRVGLHTIVGLFVLSMALLFLPKGFSTNIVWMTFLVVSVSGGASSFLFPKILGKGNESLERRLLGDSFLYQEKLLDFISSIPLSTNIKLLFEDLEVLLVKIVGLSEYRIILLDEISRGLTFFQGHPTITDGPVQAAATDSVFFNAVTKCSHDYFVIENQKLETLAKCREELVNLFFSPHAEFCFILKSDNVPYGFFLISGKKNNEPFTKTDLDLLDLLVRNLGLIINQIRLKERLQIEQELDLLGRISKGLAHDLNNLLTPVWTLLQVTASTENKDPEITALIDSATQNVSAMRNYIRDSLFFSKNMKPQMAEANIRDLVTAALGIMNGRAREKGVSFEFDGNEKVTAILDVVLFQRLISNLVSNAIDASNSGSIISLDIESTPRMNNEPNWLQLRVIDQGEGISSENLEKMKAAFFTTKDSGDGKRGFGLGLAICRKIVHLHGGTLNISSLVGRGTTVQVDLPNGSLPVLFAAERLESELAA